MRLVEKCARENQSKISRSKLTVAMFVRLCHRGYNIRNFEMLNLWIHYLLLSCDLDKQVRDVYKDKKKFDGDTFTACAFSFEYNNKMMYTRIIH